MRAPFPLPPRQNALLRPEISFQRAARGGRWGAEQGAALTPLRFPPLPQVGLNSIEDPTVKNNLMGRSRFMGKKGWTDTQGRKGKVRRAMHEAQI